MQAQDEQLSRYSASGPVYQADLTTNPPTALPQQRGPTKVTVGDRSRHMPGVRAAGCRTRSIAEVDGTSIAAAAFTRLRARELSNGTPPNAANQPLKASSLSSPKNLSRRPPICEGGACASSAEDLHAVDHPFGWLKSSCSLGAWSTIR